MAATAPLLPFLRPLGLPRASTMRRFMQFSTRTPCRAAEVTTPRTPREDPNLIASRTAPESYPPRNMYSNPRPKVSKASRRTAHPTKERHYPTRRPSHHQPEMPKLIPEPVEILSEEKSAPNLAYFVTRSNNNQLPIYTLRKRGGNLRQTKIKNVDGDRQKLKKELAQELKLKLENVAVNSVTGHILLKGHWKPQIDKFLRMRRF